MQNIDPKLNTSESPLQSPLQVTQTPAIQNTSSQEYSSSLTPTSALTTALKNGFVLVLNELYKDHEFKKMIADKSLETAYSAIEEKSGRVGLTISNLLKRQETFQKSESTNYESLKQEVDKYNQDFNNIVGGSQNMIGGSKRRKKQYLFTRRRFSSRAFRKTRGRTRSSQ